MSLTGSTRYHRVVPNSHFWTDLEQLVLMGKYQSRNLTKEYLLIGLTNSIKNGYKLKQITKPHLGIRPFAFTSIEDMLKFVNDMPDKVGCTMDVFLRGINNTINNGMNLTNGKKMEKEEVYKVVDGELAYQDIKWNARNLADGVPDEEKPVAEWLNYIDYHMYMAKNANYFLKKEESLAELRKVAALAIRALMIHGCPERKVGSILNPLTLDPTTMKPREDRQCSCDDCDCKKSE